MELSVKKGKIPQLMIDKTELKQARFLSKRADHDIGETLYVFALPESIVVEKPKKSRKKKEDADSEIEVRNDNGAEALDESE